MTATAHADRQGRLVRWSPLGGIVFVVGIVIVFLTPAGEEAGNTSSEVVAYAEDNEFWIGALAVFSLLSVLLLGLFTAGLGLRLRDTGARVEAAAATVGGLLFTILSFLAITIWTAPLFGIVDGDATETDKVSTATTYLAIDDIGWVTMGGAGVGAGVMAIAASHGARRVGLVPAWAGWLGVALGVVSLATVAFVGIFAWLAWILLASLVLLAKR